MNIPDFWAEGRAPLRERGKDVTLRRFGWSLSSQADAQRMADERAQQARAERLAGAQVPVRERKLPYNGADGLPIREQVVARHGEEVITRNSYGALCLNTPHVLIADVDLADAVPSPRLGVVALGLLAALVLVIVLWQRQPPGGAASRADMLQAIVLCVAALLVGAAFSRWRRRRVADTASLRAQAMARVDAFMTAHPDWGLRVYQTPAGLRLLATHRRFDPLEPAVTEFFETVRADRQYVAMCRNQRCFRARLTGKPWRMGVADHLRPRPGVWPVAPERLAERQAWLARYDERARDFAACRFDRTLGRTLIDRDVAPVVQLHDEQCAALDSARPLA